MFHKTIYTSYSYPKILRTYSKQVLNFLQKDPELCKIQKYLPSTYLNVSSKIADEHLYLICPKAAKKIADHVVNSIKENQIIAETNTGLGLITTELLEKGIHRVRMYESCIEFRTELKNFGTVYPGRVELFIKNIFHLQRCSYMDKQDGSNRVDLLLKNVSKKAWTDDPVMTIIGTMTNTQFLKYLMRSLALQTGPALYGRIQIFAIMKKRDYQILSATPDQTLRFYQKVTILFQLLFDFEILDTFPRNIFLPWERCRRGIKRKDIEEEMVLTKINFKKNFQISSDKILPLFFFIKQLFGTGNNLVVPTAEKWVTNSGLNILIPKLRHDEYFNDINILTKFKELTPLEILAVFREIIKTSSYAGSPFTDMVESELIKSETVETSLAEAVLEKRIVRDVENINYQDDF